jgi:hypothetical protein
MQKSVWRSGVCVYGRFRRCFLIGRKVWRSARLLPRVAGAGRLDVIERGRYGRIDKAPTILVPTGLAIDRILARNISRFLSR